MNGEFKSEGQPNTMRNLYFAKVSGATQNGNILESIFPQSSAATSRERPDEMTDFQLKESLNARMIEHQKLVGMVKSSHRKQILMKGVDIGEFQTAAMEAFNRSDITSEVNLQTSLPEEQFMREAFSPRQSQSGQQEIPSDSGFKRGLRNTNNQLFISGTKKLGEDAGQIWSVRDSQDVRSEPMNATKATTASGGHHKNLSLNLGSEPKRESSRNPNSHFSASVYHKQDTSGRWDSKWDR